MVMMPSDEITRQTATRAFQRFVVSTGRCQDAGVEPIDYTSFLKKADPRRNTIRKTRYCLPYEGQLFEIDVFPFWQDRAYLEIELKNEDQSICFPPEIELIREVTEDPRYTNAALSLQIPMDDIDP